MRIAGAGLASGAFLRIEVWRCDHDLSFVWLYPSVQQAMSAYCPAGIANLAPPGRFWRPARFSSYGLATIPKCLGLVQIEHAASLIGLCFIAQALILLPSHLPMPGPPRLAFADVPLCWHVMVVIGVVALDWLSSIQRTANLIVTAWNRACAPWNVQ